MALQWKIHISGNHHNIIISSLLKYQYMYTIIKFTIRAQGSECSDTIRRSWAAVDNLTASDSGLDWLSKEFRLCKQIKKVEAVQLKSYLNEARGIYCTL